MARRKSSAQLHSAKTIRAIEASNDLRNFRPKFRALDELDFNFPRSSVRNGFFASVTVNRENRGAEGHNVARGSRGGKMRVELLLILCSFVISSDCGWRSTIGEGGGHESSRRRNSSLPKMTIGLVVPHTNFGVREYTKAVNRTVGWLRKSYDRLRGPSSFLDKYDFTQHSVRLSMMTLTPSPTGIYD